MNKTLNESSNLKQGQNSSTQEGTTPRALQLSSLLRELLTEQVRGELDDRIIEAYVQDISRRTLAHVATFALDQHCRVQSVVPEAPIADLPSSRARSIGLPPEKWSFLK